MGIFLGVRKWLKELMNSSFFGDNASCVYTMTYAIMNLFGPSVLIIFENVIIIILLALGCVLYKFNLFIYLYFFIKIKMKHKISR